MINLLFPFSRSEMIRFLPMAVMCLLLTTDYHLLRNIKETLIVTHPHLKAEALPFIKTWFLLPIAWGFSVGYIFLSSRFSQKSLFFMIFVPFIIYYVLFFFVFYPNREFIEWQSAGVFLKELFPVWMAPISEIFRHWYLSFFYIISEMWGTTVILLLFWGFANRMTHPEEAKRLYPFLIFLANLSGVCSGRFTVWASSGSDLTSIEKWENVLNYTATFVTITGIIVAFIFYFLYRYHFQEQGIREEQLKVDASKTPLSDHLRQAFSTRGLWPLMCMTCAYFFTTSLMEVLWYDQLNVLHPDPVAFNMYLNQVTIYIGIFSTLLSLIGAAQIVKYFPWGIAASATPFLLLPCGILIYFFSTSGSSDPVFLRYTVGLGAVYFSLNRICKYTFFDVSKELAFTYLPLQSQVQGKPLVDSLCPKLGKSCEGIYLQLLLGTFQTLSSALPVAIISISFIKVFWIWSAYCGQKFITEKKQIAAIPS